MRAFLWTIIGFPHTPSFDASTPLLSPADNSPALEEWLCLNTRGRFFPRVATLDVAELERERASPGPKLELWSLLICWAKKMSLHCLQWKFCVGVVSSVELVAHQPQICGEFRVNRIRPRVHFGSCICLQLHSDGPSAVMYPNLSVVCGQTVRILSGLKSCVTFRDWGVQTLTLTACCALICGHWQSTRICKTNR